MKKISISTSCFNEEDNIKIFYEQVVDVLLEFKDRYDYEIVIADNSSSDKTPFLLREIAAKDKHVKIILNSRNFGPDRSGYNALLHTTGDAVVAMASDLQNPPHMIRGFIEKWEQGFKIVITTKTNSEESRIIYALRTFYYKTLGKLSNINLIPNFTGFGLYDRQVIEILRSLQDPYPYFRGLISDIGFQPYIFNFTQPARKFGKSKSNFLYLYEEAMLGVTSYTKIPLRLATMFGFLVAVISFIVGLFYLVYKLINWQTFSAGAAPVVVGLFFFGAIQLFFLGIVGEYIGAIYTQVLHRPLVIEKERINFDSDKPEPSKN